MLATDCFNWLVLPFDNNHHFCLFVQFSISPTRTPHSPSITGKSAIITNTATATLRQVISLLFDRVSMADPADGDDPSSIPSTPTNATAAARAGTSSASIKPSRLVRRSKSLTLSSSSTASTTTIAITSATSLRTPRVPSTSSAASVDVSSTCSTGYVESVPAWDVQALLQSLNRSARCSWLLLHDLCLLCSGDQSVSIHDSLWLKLSAQLPVAVGLELLEVILNDYHALIRTIPAFTQLLKVQVCPLVIRLLSDRHAAGAGMYLFSCTLRHIVVVVVVVAGRW
jgi:hypothetical protein